MRDGGTNLHLRPRSEIIPRRLDKRRPHSPSPTLRTVRVGDGVLLALASGIGEELLFRGWLQTETGIVAASLFFGPAPVRDARARPSGLYAAGMGFGLGGLFADTDQGLWAPIIAHTLNNGIGLTALIAGRLPNPAP